jgi:tetratricopeptide (TPR) repeat protein
VKRFVTFAEASASSPGRCVIVEAGRGAARRAYLESVLDAARSAGTEAHAVSCSIEAGGPWAGLADILRVLLPAIDAGAPELVRRHAYELSHALPELRTRFPLTDGSLTDASPVKERVRSYPMDRAYRLLHGLIDLLAAWLPRHGKRVVVVCDDFDAAGALMRRFFRELVRRRLEHVPLDLVFVADIGAGAVAADTLRIDPSTVVATGVPPQPEAVDVEAMKREADLLEQFAEAHLGSSEAHLPRLIYCSAASGQVARAHRWRVAALAIYNHWGLYEDALFFGEPLLADIDRACADARFTRWLVVSGLFNALVAIGQAERAYQIVHDEGLLKVTDPKDRISIYYTLAMLHCRFLRNRDLAKAEEFLDKSLETIEIAELAESDRHYLAVFSLNGLAFIRHLQGRVAEAVELCRAGFERLNTHLRDDQYRLHRSVLLYNIAQVHTSTRSFADALAHYTAAMESDPRYSEYHNERGNVFLKLGRVDEAIRDYRNAIELSAPYQEVWTNLGQAYKLRGDAADAVAAYSTALDLDPAQLLPRLGRAQAYETLNRKAEALADYTAALALDASDARVWSNRAVLNFELGHTADAVDDLDQAIARAPSDPELYFNRALALLAADRDDEAARDRETSLRLRGGAPDADGGRETARPVLVEHVS